MQQIESEHLVQSCSCHNNFDRLCSYNTSRSKLVTEPIADYLIEKLKLIKFFCYRNSDKKNYKNNNISFD